MHEGVLRDNDIKDFVLKCLGLKIFTAPPGYAVLLFKWEFLALLGNNVARILTFQTQAHTTQHG